MCIAAKLFLVNSKKTHENKSHVYYMICCTKKVFLAVSGHWNLLKATANHRIKLLVVMEKTPSNLRLVWMHACT